MPTPAGFSLWMVAHCLCVAGQVGMRETRLALLPVGLAVKLLSGGEPLVRFQRVTAFVHLSVPADSAMEPFGFASDELSLGTSLVLLPQPVEVAEPYEGRDVLNCGRALPSVGLRQCPIETDDVEHSSRAGGPSPSSPLPSGYRPTPISAIFRHGLSSRRARGVFY